MPFLYTGIAEREETRIILGCWEEEIASVVKATLFLKKHAFHLLSVLHDFVALARCKS